MIYSWDLHKGRKFLLVILSIGSVLTHELFSVHIQSNETGLRRKIHKGFNFSLRRGSWAKDRRLALK